DGSINLVHHRDVDRFVVEGLRMTNGEIIPLDLVVLATGYQNQQEGIRRLFGDQVADRVGPIWGFDSNFEMRGLWKQTPQPGLWVVGGNLLDCRLKSRWTALQLKAAVEGILPTVLESSAP
ncbi:MAG TPA: monooxygenase, partial [Pseudonocardia sp.]